MADGIEIFPPNMINPAPQGNPMQPVQMPDVGSMQQMAPLVNPAPPGLPEKRPPASPQEFEERKAGWTNIIEQIKSNPQLLQAMITTGTAMMGGQRPGETAGGVVGRGIQGGMMHYQMLQDNETRNQQKQQELDQRGMETEARVGASNASTDKTRQDIAFDAQEQPTKLSKLQSQATEATLKSKVAQLELKYAEAMDRQDPTGAVRIKNELDKAAVELERVRSAAASSYANAGESSERRRNLKGDNDAEDILANPKSTKEQKDAARERLQAGRMGGGGSRGSAQVEMLNAFKENYVKMNPGANEQQVAKAADEFVRKRNAGSRAAEIKGFVDSGIYTAKEGRAMLEEEGLLPGAGAAPAKGAGNKRLKFDSSGNIIR